MTLGTLRDQVIYPDTVEDQRRKGISDDAIADYLDKVSEHQVNIKAIAPFWTYCFGNQFKLNWL